MTIYARLRNNSLAIKRTVAVKRKLVAEANSGHVVDVMAPVMTSAVFAIADVTNAAEAGWLAGQSSDALSDESRLAPDWRAWRAR